MAPDVEAELERRIRAGARATPRAWPRDAIDALVAEGRVGSPKQGRATLEKWCRKGRYDYGVALDLGWVVDAGGSHDGG